MQDTKLRKLMFYPKIFIGILLVGYAGGVLARRAGAEHFAILLRADAGTNHAEAGMDTTPPLGGVNHRPVLTVKAGEPIQITWSMKSGFPHGVMKNATVHFFVVREAQLAQKPVPDPAGKGGIVDDHFSMDFAPQSEAKGAVKFTITQPGSYLVRVQSEDTHEEHDHEHFSAIDLSVQPVPQP